jgi:hypothetical protein
VWWVGGVGGSVGWWVYVRDGTINIDRNAR